MRNTDREDAAVTAVTAFIARQTGETFIFDHRPDEAPVAGSRPKAPDYLFRGGRGELMAEHTALARHVPAQQRRAHASRMYKAIGTATWPAGAYCVNILTSDVREIERLVRSGGLAALIENASRLTSVEALDLDARLAAFHARDPRYYVSDASGLVMLSKDADAGLGPRISGPPDSAPADGEMLLGNQDGAVLRVPTTSRSQLDMEFMPQALEELFEEAEVKFQCRNGCRNLLLIDVAHYVAGPILIVKAIEALPPSRWPRITAVVVYVDEPYSTPPPPSGKVSGAFRMWSIGTLTGTS